jgi:iron complex outermembrane receptor protein
MNQRANLFLRASCLAFTAFFGIAAPGVRAQEDKTHAKDAGIEDIVVTANRREERLQDVPVSISAFGTRELEKLQIRDLSGLGRIAPSLTVSRSQADRTSIVVTLRGLVQVDQVTAIDPAVGIYIDGIYTARNTGGNSQLIDLQRIEVLRGPQGTLFGRNTIGGAVNIVPNKPNGEFGGYTELKVGNYNLVNGSAVLNLPISQELAFRVAGSLYARGGFARNGVTGSDLANLRSQFVRAQLRYEPAPGWEVLLSGDYSHNSSDGEWATLIGADVATAAATLAQLAPYVNPYARVVYPTFSTGFSGHLGGASATVTGQLGAATVKSITAYREAAKTYGAVDFDATPYNVQGQLGGFSSQHQWTQELQLYGKALANRLDWIVGAFYFRERGTDNNLNISSAPIVIPPTQLIPRGQTIATNKSLGAFAQITYTIVDSLRLTAGIRYTRDTRAITAQNGFLLYATGLQVQCGIARAGPLPDCSFTPPAATFDYFPFSVGLDYKIDRTLLYAKFSRGFRSGGFNGRGNGSSVNTALAAAASVATPFLPERVSSYEAGIKSDIFDGHLRLNLSVYHAEYSQIQVRQLISPPPPATLTSYIVNGGNARFNGYELEATALLGPLSVHASTAYTDPKYTKLNVGIVTPTLDSRFILVPAHTASVAADYAVPSKIGDWNLHVDWDYKSRTYYSNTPPDSALAQQAAYGLWNAAVEFKLKAQPITLTAWVQNLADKQYQARILLVPGSATGTASSVTGFPGDPRTFGGTVRYTF